MGVRVALRAGAGVVRGCYEGCKSGVEDSRRGVRIRVRLWMWLRAKGVDDEKGRCAWGWR